MASISVATNPRIEGIRKMWPDVKWTGPCPADETRTCLAYDRHHNPIGRFAVRACDCITQDTVGWSGWYWSLQMVAEAGATLFPHAALFGFDDDRPISGIRRM